MAIRKHLLVPEIDEKRVAYLKNLIEEIENKIDEEDVNDLISNFQKEINYKLFDWDYFNSFHSFESSDEFALKAFLFPKINVIDGITREELVWIVEQILGVNKLYEYYLELLQRNVPFVGVSDLIFYSHDLGYTDDISEELTAEQIVEIALSNSNN